MDKKKLYTCYFLLFVFPFFGLHRFYLRQWKAAFTYIFLIILPFLIRDILSIVGVDFSNTQNKVYIVIGLLLWATLFIWEAFSLPKNLERKNHD